MSDGLGSLNIFKLFSLQASAISRKLDVVHDVLLKKADEVLYVHLKQLSIPAQTYGM